MRVYIAGPMSGLPNYNYPAFHAAASDLHYAGHKAISPATTLVDGWEYADYLRRAIGMLLTAQAVALLPGWQASPGARLEVDIANALGMRVDDLAAYRILAPT